MKTTITGRHMDLTDALRAYIDTALKKIEAHFDKVIEADVVLDVEKHRHIAEINLNANGVRIHGREASQDMYASVDAVMAKLEKQIRKYRDRINRHHPRSQKDLQSYQYAIISMEPDNGHGEANSEEPLHKVVQREKISMKPMTVEEAVMQLELVDDPFLVFSNADTSQVNVLYARDDNTYGLIEPQF